MDPTRPVLGSYLNNTDLYKWNKQTYKSKSKEKNVIVQQNANPVRDKKIPS